VFFYKDCLILQPVHKFGMCVTALQLGDVDYRRLALNLTSSSGTQIRTRPVLK